MTCMILHNFDGLAYFFLPPHKFVIVCTAMKRVVCVCADWRKRPCSVYSPFWINLVRYNPSTGQTTYQMYGAYNAANPMMAPQAQVPVQPQVYQQPPMQVCVCVCISY